MDSISPFQIDPGIFLVERINRPLNIKIMNKLLSEDELGFWSRRLQRKMIDRLWTIDKREWLSIGHGLNNWEFSHHFYDLIPKWWNKRPRKWVVFLQPISDVIDKEFSHKEQLRYHNVQCGSITNEEFEYWYDHVRGDGRNAEKTDYYDRRRYIDRIEWWKDEVFEAIKFATPEYEHPF